MKEIMRICISLDESMTVTGSAREICMVGFSGKADGPYFQGKILPWGVDTQKRKGGRLEELSARYMLKGVDREGCSCRIFIENNGWERADGILRTRPMIVTDSPALTWLERAKLCGEIEAGDGAVVIHITAEEELEAGEWSFEKREVRIERELPVETCPNAEKQGIYGKLYLPKTQEKCPAVILSHGYNGSGDDFQKECEYFASHGMIALAIDFCGGSVRSRSGGHPENMTVLTEQGDLSAAVDYVKGLEKTDSERIFLLGGSQGGFVSALTAAGRPKEIRGMVLYYPAFCIPDNWKEKFPEEDQIPDTLEFWGLTLGGCYFRTARSLEPFGLISGYDGPVLMIHGDEDEIVPLSYSVRARSEYDRAELVVLAGEGHGFTPAAGAAAAREAQQFFARHSVLEQNIKFRP